MLNEFQRVATVSRSMSFYVKGKNAISLAFVSNMPTSCKTNFQVQVNQGVNLTPGEQKRPGILKTAFTFKLMGQIIQNMNLCVSTCMYMCIISFEIDD